MRSKIMLISVIMCTMLALVYMIFTFQQKKISEDYKILKSVKVNIPLENLIVLNPKKGILSRSKNKTENYKFIIYHDSLQCSGCELKKMPIWNGIISKTESFGIGMDYYFIFSPPKGSEDEFKKSYLNSRLLYPVYIDAEFKFSQANPFIRKSNLYHCFVLDKGNKIVFMGNPAKNLDIENKYLDFLEKLKLQ